MSEKKPEPRPVEPKRAPCARKGTRGDEDAKGAEPKPLFRIVPVDPKDTLSFEDTADK